MSHLIPLPPLPITVRPATRQDLPFIDALQKKHSKAVGWMPTKSLEGKIGAGHVLVAEGVGKVDSGELRVDRNAHSTSLSTLNAQPSTFPSPLGYLIAADRYFKRDDVGIVYQMNVLPSHQRGLIGATLLKAQFERSAYGCKLYCCWCAQDLAANKFWEAMGFVALAFRTGGRGRGKVESGELRVERNAGSSSLSTLHSQPSTLPSARTHIFWQKRIRAGDTTTPWWYPAKTDAGSMRADRLVLPIPPGVLWSDEMPTLLPDEPRPSGSEDRFVPAKALPHGRGSSAGKLVPGAIARPQPQRGRAAMQFGPPRATPVAPATTMEKIATPKVKATPCDPKLIAAARELRDRWLERVNAEPRVAIAGKYEVSRSVDATTGVEVVAVDAKALPIRAPKLLTAA